MVASRDGGTAALPPGIRSWSDGRVPKEAGRPYEIIVIGCSMGGMHALEVILGSLQRGALPPIVVVQHRYRSSSEALPQFLRQRCELDVVDATDKEWIRRDHVYMAPADYHLLVDRQGELSLSLESRVAWSRPSVDVLFESVAEAYGAGAIAVVLTGANEDGARGAAQIKKNGGVVIVQDPKTAESKAMPQAAIDATRVDRILPLERIGPFLVEICRDNR